MTPLAVTLGDPAGIGSEIVFAALASLDLPVWVFGDRAYAEAAVGSDALVPYERIDVSEAANRGGLARAFVDVAISQSAPLTPGVVDARCGAVSLASIEAAVAAVERGDCSALVTAPIHKQAIRAAGSEGTGHTEILAKRAGLTRYGWDHAMYFDSPRLRIVLLSVHLPLQEAIASITADRIAALAVLTASSLARLAGRRPSIAVAGLNPHAGEGGLFGVEEETIARGVALARERGVTVTGPHAADTLFHEACEGRHDVVMAMYHDQGLIPIKTIAFDESVNVTLGLPYLRVSVDHGTAFDIAGKQMANARPMRHAIEWAWRHVGQRQ
ncbi:MAG TPA: 4-hydroxythreonine-4-phosphate dehydrogenase PdxA [Thermoanaerobaculia bacterium]|nr:4-hydroxythreonine-4-phosphate dehydrogenase PdxA [Thermoanaerobaculia bacterium]